MLIDSHQRSRGLNLTLTLDGDILRQVSSTKYLGRVKCTTSVMVVILKMSSVPVNVGR